MRLEFLPDDEVIWNQPIQTRWGKSFRRIQAKVSRIKNDKVVIKLWPIIAVHGESYLEKIVDPSQLEPCNS